jgi:hypothetical protein
MDPFILIIWLWIGQRFEETRILYATREECIERLLAIEADRPYKKAMGHCLDHRGRITFPRDTGPPKVCAHATSFYGDTTLPGRRRI